MAVHKNEHFKDETVRLDGNTFERCTFSNCHLVFRGTAPVRLDGNTMTNPKFVFDGPAMETLKFMTAMYQSGGGARDIIEAALNNIRSGKTPVVGRRDQH